MMPIKSFHLIFTDMNIFKYSPRIAAVLMILAFFGATSAQVKTPELSLKASPTADVVPEALQAGPVVLIKTTMGDIKVKLFDDTPAHRDNFLKLASENFYDSVLFHRVIKNFMVQAGDPKSKHAAAGDILGSGDPGYTIPAEIVYPKHYHKYGALAAARTADQVNPERRSSGSQFYIVTGNKMSESQINQIEQGMMQKQMMEHFQKLAYQHKDTIMALQAAKDTAGIIALQQELVRQTEAEVKPQPMPEQLRRDYETVGGAPHLDGQYTVFGQVIDGMDVVEKIQQAETGSGDRPKQDIRILSTTVLEGSHAAPMKKVSVEGLPATLTSPTKDAVKQTVKPWKPSKRVAKKKRIRVG